MRKLFELGSSSEAERSDSDGISSREQTSINHQTVLDPEESRTGNWKCSFSYQVDKGNAC